MRLRHLTARGFRNLADLECDLPASGLILLGANAQGKTNLLEAIYYPVLFRSFRGAPDQEVAQFEGPGFLVEASLEDVVLLGRLAEGYARFGGKEETHATIRRVLELAPGPGYLALELGPGIGTTRTPSPLTRRTHSKPGSEMSGVPASDWRLVRSQERTTTTLRYQ